MKKTSDTAILTTGWMELKKKNTRTYNYQFNKFKRYTKENTCSIQAQVRDIMMDTLDVLVQEFKLYIKVESSTGDYGPGSSVTFTANPNEHYNFLNWVDQSSGETYTDNQLTLQVEGDLSLEAVFERI